MTWDFANRTRSAGPPERPALAQRHTQPSISCRFRVPSDIGPGEQPARSGLGSRGLCPHLQMRTLGPREATCRSVKDGREPLPGRHNGRPPHERFGSGVLGTAPLGKNTASYTAETLRFTGNVLSLAKTRQATSNRWQKRPKLHRRPRTGLRDWTPCARDLRLHESPRGAAASESRAAM